MCQRVATSQICRVLCHCKFLRRPTESFSIHSRRGFSTSRGAHLKSANVDEPVTLVRGFTARWAEGGGLFRAPELMVF
jgi:hypothetical protein